MNISYKRDINKNYMIISHEKNQEAVYIEDYKIKMIQNNCIDGLLSVKLKYTDNCPSFIYEISHGSNMIDMFSGQCIDFKILNKIQIGIMKLMENTKIYLLDLDHIILDPELIYINTKTLYPEFCYYPFVEGSFYDNIKNMYREIIRLIDYRDQMAVELAYGLENLAMEDRYSIEMISNLMKSSIQIKPAAYINAPNEIEKNVNREYRLDDDEVISKKFMKQKNIIDIIKDKFNSLKGVKNTKDIKDMVQFSDDKIEADINHKSEIYSRGKMINNETTVLSQDDSLNITLLSMDQQRYENIFVYHFPCTIGKQESKVDKVIVCPTVSRVHAKFIETDGEIFLEDLNSTNGTYINDIVLHPYNKNKLKHEDFIRMGEVRYQVWIRE